MIANARTPQQALAALLEQYQPERILQVGQSRPPALDAYLAGHPHSQVDHIDGTSSDATAVQQRYDLALIVDCLEHLPKRRGRELLGGIRNLHASRLAVLVDLEASDWQTTEFFSLGLQIADRFQRDAQTLTLFTYDLLDYKQIPDWLNAKFWANPQMFGKYWW